MKTTEALVLEACALGDEAIRTAFRANALAYDDPRRWPLSRRMLEINERLRQITKEIRNEDRDVQKPDS